MMLITADKPDTQSLNILAGRSSKDTIEISPHSRSSSCLEIVTGCSATRAVSDSFMRNTAHWIDVAGDYVEAKPKGSSGQSASAIERECDKAALE